MVHVGRMNSLKILRATQSALFLDGGDGGTLVVPRPGLRPGLRRGLRPGPSQKLEKEDSIDVFVYTDEDGRISATTKNPNAMVGDFAPLRIISVTDFGAFLDWGIEVDLLVPVREQTHKLEVGLICVAYLFLDRKNGKVTASCNVEKFLGQTQPKYRVGQEVSLLIYEETKLGYKGIIDSTCWGMIYRSEIYRDLCVGEQTRGFIKKLRDDGKIDLWLDRPGGERVDSAAETILHALKRQNGRLFLTDSSSPQAISEELGMSKKTFKKALGNLYKRKIVSIEDDSVCFVHLRKRT